MEDILLGKVEEVGGVGSVGWSGRPSGHLPIAASGARHILVVDDDKEVRTIVVEYLVKNGFAVSQAADGRSMRDVMESSATTKAVDLVIIDLIMPGDDGLTLTRMLRESGYQGGIIMLTGSTDPTESVIALEFGADDYMSKPYRARELLARVRSILRRVAGWQKSPGTSPGNLDILDFNSWKLDVAARHVIAEGGDIVELTSAEFNLLKEFLDNPGRVLSREHLMNVVHGRDRDYFDRSIDVLVTRLRRKLGVDAKTRSLVKAVRGVGYVLTARVSRGA